MKKIYLIIGGFLLLFSAKAQNYFPLPADNPFWTEEHGSLWTCGTTGTYGYCDGYYCQCTMPVYYKSDTIINSIPYNRLYKRGICSGVIPYLPGPQGCPYSFNYQDPETLFATIRQDTLNGIVYILDNNTEKILYDFKNLIVGNDYPKTYNNVLDDTLVIVAVDSILLGDVYAKKWDLGLRSNGIISLPGFVSIIEGIGSTYGILANLVPPFENSDGLQCFSLNNIVLYPDTSYDCDKTVDVREHHTNSEISIYPNPVADLLMVEIMQRNGKQTIQILNQIGEMKYINRDYSGGAINTSQFSNGMYILKFSDEDRFAVKKFIVKH